MNRNPRNRYFSPRPERLDGVEALRRSRFGGSLQSLLTIALVGVLAVFLGSGLLYGLGLAVDRLHHLLPQ